MLVIYTCMHKGEGDNMTSDDGQTVINLGSEKTPPIMNLINFNINHANLAV